MKVSMSMGNGNNRRQRAVRLTDEALEKLNLRCLKEWESMGLEGRLSRPRKAGMLGVSISTLDRITRQEGNDRTVLVAAFKHVGLRWEDRYCEPLHKEGAEVADGLAAPIPSTPSRNRPWFVLATLLVVVVVGLAIQGSRSVHESARVNRYATLAKARAAYNGANYVSARRYIQQAVEMSRADWDANAMVESIGLQGQIHAAQGDLAKAVDCFKEALSIAAPYNQENARAFLFENLGVAEARLGRLDDAEEHLLKSIEGFRKTLAPSGVAMAARGLGSVAAVQSDLAESRRWYDVASRTLKDKPQEAIHVDIRALRALLARDEGNFDLALRELEDCLAYWSRQGHPRWQAATLMQIASVHRTAGRQPDAEAAIKRAKARYESVGDRRGVELCADFLDQSTDARRQAAVRLEEFF
ncbi:MAG: hypothetical protein HONBIEJF_01034 [Fimbriimonadaceae bacterium]|nr:hypothetical protein [Fimbriimonadaceae bacterium]